MLMLINLHSTLTVVTDQASSPKDWLSRSQSNSASRSLRHKLQPASPAGSKTVLLGNIFKQSIKNGEAALTTIRWLHSRPSIISITKLKRLTISPSSSWTHFPLLPYIQHSVSMLNDSMNTWPDIPRGCGHDFFTQPTLPQTAPGTRVP